MTPDKWIYLIVLTVSMSLYVSQRVPVIISALVTIAAMVFTGLLTLDEAVSGFSNSATIAVGAMFVLSTGLLKTGALDPLTAKLAQWSSGSYPRLILAMALTVPVASAFLNNTPVVVMMVPIILSLSRKFSISPSKLLIPVSYFAILGGTCTLIGTSTNLLIDEVYRQETGQHLNIFEFLPLGLIYLAVGGLTIVLLGKRVLPQRESLSALLPQQMRSKYVTEVVVAEGSGLVGKVVGQAFDKPKVLRFLQLNRGDDFYIDHRAKDLTIQVGDALIVEGTPQELNDLLVTKGVELGSVIEDASRVPMRTYSLTLFELVVLPDFAYVGSKVKELQLNHMFGVKLLAIQRGGRHHRMDIGNMRLKGGDMLLVQGEPERMKALRDSQELLVVEEVDRQLRIPGKSWLAMAVMAFVVLGTTLTAYPLAIWAIFGVVVMVLSRCLRTDQAIQALDFNVLFLLIGTIPLGLGLERTGLTDDIARLLSDLAGEGHPFMLLSLLYLVTNVLTHLLSNTAVAVLMAPVALGLARTMGYDPIPLLVAVAFAASAAFATPLGYQTNLIVMGPGGYKFSDYLRLGLPLSLIMWVTASIAIPLLWPLQPV